MRAPPSKLPPVPPRLQSLRLFPQPPAEDFRLVAWDAAEWDVRLAEDEVVRSIKLWPPTLP